MKIKTRIYFWIINKVVPEEIKPILKKIMYPILDGLHYLKNGWNSMIPPPSKVFIGTGNYLKTGSEFADYFTRLGGLQGSHSVLDIGCGSGRMAIPLTDILIESGSYEGLDIVREGIDWASKRISSKFDNFTFTHSDIYNELYNPDGKIQADKYVFPFNDNKFDFVFLTSVFTHMLPSDLKNYLKEISRVLKPDGKCMITYFLLNDESLGLISDGMSTIDFKYKYEECLTNNAVIPEDAIAYKEDQIRTFYSNFNLRILEPISYGSWCNRNVYLSYQDIVVGTKAAL